MKKWLKKNRILVWIVFVLAVSIISTFIPLRWFFIYLFFAMSFGSVLDYIFEDKDDEPQPKRKLIDLLKSRDS